MNTIWSLNDPSGRSISSFKGMAHLGKRRSQNLFKFDEQVSIAQHNVLGPLLSKYFLMKMKT
jgi:hypothetical protein